MVSFFFPTAGSGFIPPRYFQTAPALLQLYKWRIISKLPKLFHPWNMGWINFSLTTAVRVAFVSSSLLISLCLFLIMMTSREINEFREQTLDDLKEWKYFSDAAWKEMTGVSIRKPRNSGNAGNRFWNKRSYDTYSQPQSSYARVNSYATAPVLQTQQQSDQCSW